MRPNSVRRTSALAALTIAGVLSACEDRRASVFDPFGPLAYNFRFAKTATNLPRGTVAVALGSSGPPAVPRAITFTFQGLEPLTSGVYEVWLAPGTAVTAGTFVKATGNLTVTRTDTSVNSLGDLVFTTSTVRTASNVSSFADGGAAVTVKLVVDQSSFGSDPLVGNIIALVTVEATAGASAPGTVQPLWRRFSNTTNNTGALTFGNFDPDPAKAYVYIPAGRGTASVRGSILVVDDSALTRPPIGYYYATYVIKRDSAGKAIDTLVLGAQTAPFPNRSQSLRDADVSLISGIVIDAPPSILAAANRVDADTIPRLAGANPYRGFTELILTLENKAGDDATASPAIVLVATVPGIVTRPPTAP
ncbi:MAG: hypothetical protein ABR543_05245 [Gemmatimonadaceae bacterium]